MIVVAVSVTDIDSVLAAGYTQYQVFTDTSATGSFATSDGTGTLVAQQMGYTYVDTDGSTGTYYKVAYYGAGVGTSSMSDPLQGGQAQYYCTALEVRQELAAGASDDAAIGTHDDEILWDMCEEASRLIDDYKRVEPGAYLASSSTSSRYFTGSGETWQDIDPATSVTVVEVEETDGTYTAWTIDTDCYRWPYNYDSIDEPVVALQVVGKSGSSKSVFNVGPRRVRVAGTWGISSTPPAPVRRAARIQVARWYKRAQQAWQDAAANPELGELVYVKEMDPDVRTALRSVYPTTGAGF